MPQESPSGTKIQSGSTGVPLANKSVGVGLVAASDGVFAVLLFPAVSNISFPGAGSVAFQQFYAILSLATPALMAAAAVVLIYGLVYKHRKHSVFVKALRAAQVLQRAIFWLLVLKVVSLTVLSFFIVNESGSATFLILTAVLLLVPVSVVAAGTFYIGRLLSRLRD